jgi:hypothetical protein
MKNYTTRLIDLFMEGGNWTREHTLEAYKLLDYIIIHEINIKNCSSSGLKSALRNLSDLLYSEATMKGQEGAEEDSRSSVLEIAKNLKVITDAQIETIVNNFI